MKPNPRLVEETHLGLVKDLATAAVVFLSIALVLLGVAADLTGWLI